MPGAGFKRRPAHELDETIVVNKKNPATRAGTSLVPDLGLTRGPQAPAVFLGGY